jgi:hypothetical protein
MSDLIKAQQTPQFNWYTCWTSLVANGMPDKLIEKGMKQTDCIKITFKKGTKDVTGYVVLDQAQIGPEYCLTLALCWTSLGADGMPDKLIKEGMKQPDCIKITFKKGAKDITGHVAPDQA